MHVLTFSTLYSADFCQLCCLYFSATHISEPDLEACKKREQLLQTQLKTAKRDKDQRISQLQKELQLREEEILSLKEQLENKNQEIFKLKPELQSKENENTQLTSMLYVHVTIACFAWVHCLLSIPSLRLRDTDNPKGMVYTTTFLEQTFAACFSCVYLSTTLRTMPFSSR